MFFKLLLMIYLIADFTIIKSHFHVTDPAYGPARCSMNEGGCWSETRNGLTFSACLVKWLLLLFHLLWEFCNCFLIKCMFLFNLELRDIRLPLPSRLPWRWSEMRRWKFLIVKSRFVDIFSDQFFNCFISRHWWMQREISLSMWWLQMQEQLGRIWMQMLQQ